MTEEEWLASTKIDKMLQHLAAQSGLSRRKGTLFEVGCVRITEVSKEQRRLWNAVRIAEQAADTGDWDEIEILTEAIGIPRGKASRSASYYWGCATSWLGGEGVLPPILISEDLIKAASAATKRSTRGLRRAHADILHDIFGDPFRPVAFDPSWFASTAVAIAQGMYESRDFSAMPILADALQDAGCDNDDILNHCRGSGPHVRGCWVVDHVLGKT